MLRSWKLGSVRGIAVHIHWTFWLLLIFYTLSAAAAGGVWAGLFTGLFLALVFACVVAHEFGHAFAAAAYGIPTHDITLLPIGGLARLARLPKNPRQELVIALAGPAVNVVIALALLLMQAVLQLPAVSESAWMLVDGGLIANLIAANWILVLFNMLPAFPLDGGRVLRSLIAMRTSHLRATEIAARVGRWLALAFVLVGCVYGPLGLALIGLFVFLAGTFELWQVRTQAVAESNGPLFQWSWNGGSPLGQQPFPGRPQPLARGDVVDAVEVREIKRAPSTGF